MHADDQPAVDAGTHVRRRRLGWTAAQIVVLAVAVYLVLPQLAGIERIGKLLASALWWVGILALLLEAASLIAYSELMRAALGGMGATVRRPLLMRLVLVGTALGKTMPGGTLAGMPFIVRSLQIAGTRPAVAAAAAAGSGMISSAVLAALLPVALLLSIVAGDGRGVAPQAVALALVTVVAVAGVFVVLRDPVVVARVVRRGARLVPQSILRRVDPARLAAAAEAAVVGLHQLGTGKVRWRATGWAAANWLLDAAALALIAVAVGGDVPLSGLLLAYIFGQLVAAAPFTPGGVGVVEATMIAAIVAQGASAAGAAATVLGWRLVSHWIPIAIGLLLLPTLPTGAKAGAERSP